MKLLPRRSSSAEEAVAEAATPVEEVGSGVVRKGRPTPKRRDATGTRGPAAPPPRTRKEAYRWQKEQAAKDKAAKAAGGAGGGKALSREAYREALRRGDPSVLPRRDQGPLKALARDYVDARPMLSNYLLFAFIPLLLGPFISFGNAAVASALQLATFALLVVVLIEWFFTGRKLRRAASERGIELTGSAMGLGFYAGSRAYLPRRWRLPQPRKARGDQW